ncbi:hypothetical protein FDG2_4489 [Candidatus Protofrankia californiensis]|uniref:Integral membrane protein n=1 Tax=Candidatus Protofrankia californiensis TaxID=1839754 RepID=A0A1C3P638_9ACTN|nr:hypothetical protein FDG2_4489 [Candidatus Protofrankia californiensis]
MSENPSSSRTAEVDLAEYEHLKAEQLGRIGVRDNLVYATLAACGGVVALSFGGERPRPAALLLLPPVCLLLGWTYVVNDQKVSAIGRYLRRVLGPRLGAGEQHESLGWETERYRDASRRRRKLAQLGVNLTLFCGSSVGALGVFWSLTAPTAWLLLAVSFLETAAAVLLAVEIAHCSETTTTL